MTRTRTAIIVLPIIALLLSGNAAAQKSVMLLARGDSAQLAMKPETALRYYRMAEKADAQNPEVLWRIAKIHTDFAIGAKDDNAGMREVERAIDYARRAVAAGPGHAMAHAMLAIAYGQKAAFAPNSEKLDLTKLLYEHAKRALELDPSNNAAMLVLGIWHREMSSLNWAVKLLLKAVYGDTPEASAEESQRLLARAVELKPDQIIGHLELAKTLIELDDEKAAAAQLRKAVALPKRDVHDGRRITEARELLRELD
ncbi:MAG: hypothetical protein IH600_06440 [Bacteroidetes bacterium]|nr:hypothetical protein [Bacteroidota bacterium]